ncbi:MAG: hypothetical protein IV108_09455 [Burkholderiales bacterium]|nr:hypothetical protein [Burkholderiales bacterium]
MKRLIWLVVGLVCATALQAETQAERWNRFADQVYQLHLKIITAQPTRSEESTHAYEGDMAKNYTYRETQFFSVGSNKLLSKLRVDQSDPSKRYYLEANVLDSQGRVARDYIALYLPWAMSQPARTFISLHAYPGELHAFRQFNATGQRILEICEGRLQGKKVMLLFEEADLDKTPEASEAYRACFGGLPVQVGEFLNSQ